MSAEEQKEMMEDEHERRLHAQNLQAPPQEDHTGETAEILRYLSEIDDLPVSEDDPVMGQLVSKLTSTANLTEEQVRSNEWVFEYILVLYLCKHPSKDGMHTHDRAWSHDDADAYRDPIDPADRMAIEAFVGNAKMALTRSKDMEVVKESTRTVNESIVNNDSQSRGKSGGILGKVGLR
jgi:hypothetical protein